MPREHRRGALLRPAAAALLAAAAALGGGAHAQDEDRALASFARPAAPAPRNLPVDAQEWERSLRAATCFHAEQATSAAGCFGAPLLRPADAALLAAARGARWADALQLLKSGQAGANAQDAAGGNTLVLAARSGQDELVRELIKRGANTERVGEDGFTALGAAAFAGHHGTVRLMLRAGVDPRRWGSTGQSALHLAAMTGQVPVLDELLRAGLQTELLNRLRESALDVAAAAGQQDAMERLIKAGANLNLAGRR